MKITGSLIVCSLAAAFTAGTLLLNPDPAPAPAPAAAASPPAPGAPAAPPQITIQGFAFTSVTARPGEAITVQNLDETEHTVSSSDGAFDTGVIPPQGTSTVIAPLTPGVYSFVCAIHPSMIGQLTVVAG
jgi:plastocyanin